MKLREFLKQFEGLDPEAEVWRRRVFKDEGFVKDFPTAYGVLCYQMNEQNSEEKLKAILL